eukprot:CAMPEP_0195515942 /NCGR_PEP_ID=MMETSP0794_2-20130614/6830_1 /TAXON_ID=515487 /ORGANISM="Stephanopyxis turris, Strain CCMP 815" /LENGTH=432 /DNA_ID=CAMNT_0040644443 /DNA_START=201 /DNA_END=1496 /DNA_ORIENTATION=+
MDSNAHSVEEGFERISMNDDETHTKNKPATHHRVNTPPNIPSVSSIPENPSHPHLLDASPTELPNTPRRFFPSDRGLTAHTDSSYHIPSGAHYQLTPTIRNTTPYKLGALGSTTVVSPDNDDDHDKLAASLPQEIGMESSGFISRRPPDNFERRSSTRSPFIYQDDDISCEEHDFLNQKFSNLRKPEPFSVTAKRTKSVGILEIQSIRASNELAGNYTDEDNSVSGLGSFSRGSCTGLNIFAPNIEGDFTDDDTLDEGASYAAEDDEDSILGQLGKKPSHSSDVSFHSLDGNAWSGRKLNTNSAFEPILSNATPNAAKVLGRPQYQPSRESSFCEYGVNDEEELNAIFKDDQPNVLNQPIPLEKQWSIPSLHMANQLVDSASYSDRSWYCGDSLSDVGSRASFSRSFDNSIDLAREPGEDSDEDGAAATHNW